jgi:hypothetical protein
MGAEFWSFFFVKNPNEIEAGLSNRRVQLSWRAFRMAISQPSDV